MKPPLRIVELRAENVKRLSAVQVKPDGSVVTISGPNGAGKSSLIDSIMYGLGGKSVRPSHPVRDGASQAEVELDLGDYRVKRVIRDGRPDQLEVRAADGQRYASPQAVLDKLTGDLTFDPLAFSRKRPLEQAEILRQLAGLDTSNIDQAEKQAFEQRKAESRELKALQAQLEAMPLDPGAPDSEEDATALRDRFVAATRAVECVSQAAERKERAEARVSQLRAELGDAESELAASAVSLDQAKETAVDNPDELGARLGEIDKLNARARQSSARRDVATKVEMAAFSVSTLDDKVKAARAERTSRIEAAEMPLPGLSIGDGDVLLNNVPLEQASQAERIRAATAIGMALNPRLRVILIRDGSSLDRAALASLTEMAEERGYQVWIERVAEPGEGVGIVIEDGSVVSEPITAETPF